MAAQEQSLLNVQKNLSGTMVNVENNLVKVVEDLETNILKKLSMNELEPGKVLHCDPLVASKVISKLGWTNPIYATLFLPNGKTQQYIGSLNPHLGWTCASHIHETTGEFATHEELSKMNLLELVKHPMNSGHFEIIDTIVPGRGAAGICNEIWEVDGKIYFKNIKKNDPNPKSEFGGPPTTHFVCIWEITEGRYSADYSFDGKNWAYSGTPVTTEPTTFQDPHHLDIKSRTYFSNNPLNALKIEQYLIQLAETKGYTSDDQYHAVMKMKNNGDISNEEVEMLIKISNGKN